jgi:hypothetical protein
VNRFRSQAEQGRYYKKVVAAHFQETVSATKTKSIIGIQWWDYPGKWGEKANSGLVTFELRGAASR